jgi:hypothetical protein
MLVFKIIMLYLKEVQLNIFRHKWIIPDLILSKDITSLEKGNIFIYYLDK